MFLLVKVTPLFTYFVFSRESLHNKRPSYANSILQSAYNLKINTHVEVSFITNHECICKEKKTWNGMKCMRLCLGFLFEEWKRMEI